MTTLAQIAPILKTIYPSGLPLDLTYKDYPMLALIARGEKFGGDSQKVPVKYGNGNKRSGSFSKAQAGTGPTQNDAFYITRSPDYAIAQIDNEAIDASEFDEYAFTASLEQEINSAMNEAISSEAICFTEDGTGTRGQLDASVNLATTQLKLRDPEMIVRFEKGYILGFSGARGATLRAGGATLTVVAINRGTGVLTMSAALNTIAGITVNDFVFVDGDFNVMPVGFGGWIPSVDPGATPFFGVDRTTDLTRLSGVRGDYSMFSIEEGLVKAVNRNNREGAHIDYAFINSLRYAELENSLGSKVVYQDVMGPIGIGFRGVKISSGKGPVTVLADNTVPSDGLFTMTSKVWSLQSLKKSIRILDGDGNKMLRMNSADANELRIGGYKQFRCDAPGWNGNFKI